MSSDHNLIITLAWTAIAILIYVIHQLWRKKKENTSNYSLNNFGGEAADEIEDPTSKPRPSPTLPLGESYEVFLNFRGEDTRRGFTDHLYRRLVDIGISVFRDSEELCIGETIAPELFRAIKASKISIPIISSNYASSKWCLNELVQILMCKKTLGQHVLPIFYKVEPSDVRNQKGSFGKAFKRYNKKHDFNSKLVQEWKNALVEVSSLKGWELDKVANGHEGELVKIVVTRVFKELRKVILDVPDLLVGVEDHVKKIMRMMEDKPLNDVKIMGIFGMGGVGKTTLAKVIYNQLSNNFEYSSFLSNIRETSFQHRGLEGLQKQVISNTLMDKSLREISNVDEGVSIIKKSFERKKLLLLLDDVENRDQLNKLAADPDWFGPQSIIIITTRNKEVIEGLESSLHYELNELDFDQSFLLFCKHAFKKDESSSTGLETIAKDITRTTGGLPLAIEIIGSLLFGKSIDTWKVTLKKLERIPNDKVQEKLRISYDALKHEEQQIFLDIACLPIKELLKNAFYMWEDCGFYPEEGIQVLISKSLIKIGDKKELIIHDQLRYLGREIVRRESYHEFGKRSRLWIQEEALEAIQEKRGTEKVQALDLAGPHEELTNEHFENLTNLRFLKVQWTNLVGDFKNSFSELRWLEWDNGPFSMVGDELRDFLATIHPKKLVVLDLSHCTLASWSQIELARRLKVLRLTCCNLATTPDFSVLRKLEILNLSGCLSLRKIHPSIYKLNKTLKILHLSYCRELEELPIEVGKMEELKELRIDETGIREIPIFEGFMTKLKTLSANNCQKLVHIPDSIGTLEGLRSLSLENCLLLTKIPEAICKLKLLKELHLACTNITELPTTIGMLSDLQALNLDYCRKLESLRNLPCSLISLKFHGDSMETLPDISYLTNLKDLKYSDAFERRNRALNLRKLNQLNTLRIFHSMVQDDCGRYEGPGKNHPQLVVFEDIRLLLEITPSPVKIHVIGCQTLQHLPNMLNFKGLSELHLKDCCRLMEISGLEGAKSLTHLRIKRCNNLSKLNSLGVLVTVLSLEDCCMLKSLHLATAKNLRSLRICRCSNLVEILGLDNIEGLQFLYIGHCSSLERVGDLSNLKMLKNLYLRNCEKLSDVEGIDKLRSLQNLSYNIDSPNVKFPDLSMLRNVKNLKIKDERIMEIPGLQELKSLVKLDISGCKSLQYLPDFTHFTELKNISIKGCENLTQIQGFEYSECYSAPTKMGQMRELPGLPKRYVVI